MTRSLRSLRNNHESNLALVKMIGLDKNRPPQAEEAFSQLLTMYDSYIRKLIYKILHAKDLEDVFQDCCLKLWRKVGLWKGDCSLDTYIYRIVHSVAVIEYWHRKGMSRDSTSRSYPTMSGATLSSLDCMLEDFPVWVDRMISTEDKVLQSSIDRLEVTRAMQLLKHRAPGAYQCLYLKYFEGYEHNEIGKIIGRSEGLSKSQCYKAKQILRQIFHVQSERKNVSSRQSLVV